jgi:hypothetical protein
MMFWAAPIDADFALVSSDCGPSAPVLGRADRHTGATGASKLRVREIELILKA